MIMQQLITRRSIAACLMSLSLVGCGESDLIAQQERELDDARLAAAAEPSVGPATPDTENGTGNSAGGSEEQGSVDNSTGGTTGNDNGSGSGAGTGAGTDGGAGTGADSGTGAGAETGGGTGTSTSGDTGGTADGNTGSQGSDALDLSAYDLVFADDFRGTTIDPFKWNTALGWGPDLVIYDQLQYYVDVLNQPEFGYNPFSLDGEQLTITAIETPENLRADANEQPWLSGVLTTADTFDFTYGYVETRVDLPPGRGIWPSFWMLSTEFDGLKPELFIMEYDGAKPDSVFHNYNYQDEEGNLRSPGQWEVDIPGFSDGFHRIGVAWSPDELLFYIDQQPRYRIVGENVARQNMYLILNLAMGGVWTGAPDATTEAPVSIVVDYVRVYQLKP